ncbi:MAG: arsinothricin resistance N-acetyltransferase ArsN1 [Gemmatimonadota bacterium]|nr:arsinothricin resistance N-acetyltransferase ArsN1 [Gemmatimonadota bacterium]
MSGMMRTIVRPAAAQDMRAVADIYNEGIRQRVATFETRERTLEEVSSWLNDAHPFLVAVDEDGRVLGWIRASPYRARECYAGIADFSVYVATTARGKRVGDALMSGFIPACAHSRTWKLVSRIFPENRASLALCARHGFREVGRYEKHAQLDGVWRDVIIVERLIPENLV